jgi:hypothetical protein
MPRPEFAFQCGSGFAGLISVHVAILYREIDPLVPVIAKQRINMFHFLRRIHQQAQHVMHAFQCQPAISIEFPLWVQVVRKLGRRELPRDK